MASYIYSAVQGAIGGKASSSGFQKDWSPNRIRALYIMRNFILVVDYLKGPKLTVIDENEVGLDLQNPNRVGSLNNLLSSRQLSCLEEIYADEAFSMYPGVLDLKAYADSVINSASRLRYYAYTSGINGEVLRQAYLKAMQEGLVDFTYAKNIGGIRYVDTENYDWYKKHNLRPQYYGPDADGGSLAAWFNKVERLIGKVMAEQGAKIQSSRELDYVCKRVEVDRAGYQALLGLRTLIRYGRTTGYELHSMFSSVASGFLKAPKPVSGLTKEMVISAAKASGYNSPSYIQGVQNVSKYYEFAGLYLADAPFDLNKLLGSEAYPEEGGFLQIGNMFDRILAGLYEKCGSNASYKYAVNVAIMSAFPEGVPNGSLAKRLSGKVRVTGESPIAYIGTYIRVFEDICGVSLNYLKGGSN